MEHIEHIQKPAHGQRFFLLAQLNFMQDCSLLYDVSKCIKSLTWVHTDLKHAFSVQVKRGILELVPSIFPLISAVPLSLSLSLPLQTPPTLFGQLDALAATIIKYLNLINRIALKMCCHCSVTNIPGEQQQRDFNYFLYCLVGYSLSFLSCGLQKWKSHTVVSVKHRK